MSGVQRKDTRGEPDTHRHRPAVTRESRYESDAQHRGVNAHRSLSPRLSRRGQTRQPGRQRGEICGKTVGCRRRRRWERWRGGRHWWRGVDGRKGMGVRGGGCRLSGCACTEVALSACRRLGLGASVALRSAGFRNLSSIFSSRVSKQAIGRRTRWWTGRQVMPSQHASCGCR